MTTNFLQQENQNFSFAAKSSAFNEVSPSREAVKIMVVGSRQGVNSIIRTLHKLGFAEVGEWSPLLPSTQPGEVMSVLTRYIITK
ncbi:MAG TPA: hypothetical protein VK203_09665 [Nostocaceae cyanobacterium]|nr:hypothetical protein [Nostocaceae cyanobacterium]